MEIACVFGSSPDDVVQALTGFCASRGSRLFEVPLAPGHGWESEQSNKPLMMTAESPRGTSVLMEEYCEDLNERVEYISAKLKRPVVAAQFYESCWGYDFFVEGKLTDSFLTDPEEYFRAQFSRELHADEAPRYKGRPDLVAKHAADVDAARVAKYLVQWTEPFLEKNTDKKAYKTDKATYGDVWQVMDLLGALGFRHPLNEAGRPIGKLLDRARIEKSP